MVTETIQPSMRAPAGGIEPIRKQLIPIKLWAFFGCLSLGLIAFSWGRWLLGGYAKRTPTGPDEVPTYMVISARIHEILCLIIAIAVWYFVIVRQRRKNGHLSFDGMFAIGMLTVWALQDPLLNFGRVVFTYNAAFTNLGCPQCHLPGWTSYGRTLPEPLIFSSAWYAGFAVLSIFVLCRILKWIEATWPRLGKIGAVGTLLLFIFVFDLVTELFWVRLGLYTYANIPPWPWLTLFYGKWYQLPIVEIFIASFWYLTPVFIRYTRDDRGYSWAERGVDKLNASSRQKSGLRLLSIIGLLNVGIFLLYNLPMIFISQTWNNWNPDHYQRSYLVNGMCGPGTDTACYDEKIPIPVGNSARATPDGKFIAPEGLPVQTD